MKQTVHRNGWVILLTFVAALVLTMIPLPFWLEVLQPQWVALALIYWCLALPERVGVGAAWLTGLFLDVLRGAVFGQHALAFAVIAYLVVRLHQRIRLFPVWQQAISVLLLVSVCQLFLIWIRGLAGQPNPGWLAWPTVVSSMLAWPVVFVLLRALRRGFKVA